MPDILVEEVVAAGRQALFTLADDYKHRLEWDSFATRIRYDHGAVTSLIGMVGSATYLNPLRMTVEHFSLLCPSMIATHMLKGPFFFERLSASWRFESVDDNTTKVVLHCQFRSRWRFINRAVDPIVGWVLERDSRRALQDLKHAAEQTDLIHRIGD